MKKVLTFTSDEIYNALSKFLIDADNEYFLFVSYRAIPDSNDEFELELEVCNERDEQ